MMNYKLKALGLSLLLAIAIGAVTAVMGASAETGGHFTSDVDHTILVGSENLAEEPHTTEFHIGGLTIKCNQVTYHGTWTAKTVTELTLTPTYADCTPAGTTVTMNGCDYKFTIRKVEPAVKHSTAHIVCPAGKKIEIHTSTCTLSIGEQTPAGGVVYTKIILNNKHALTVDVTLQNLKYQKHAGICVFGGTESVDGELTGSFTLIGLDTAPSPTNITAT